MTGWIYPIVAHWGWGEGWLFQEGYLDFAGGGIVHMVGGYSGLAGAIVLGKRIGKWDKDVE